MKLYIILLCALTLCTNIHAQTDSISEKELQTMTVVGNRSGTLMSTRTQLKTETITDIGLMKLACCNLAESFEL